MDRSEARGGYLIAMAMAGLLAGLSLWALIQYLPDAVEDERLILAISAAAGAFFTVLLAAFGPLRAAPALAAGVLVAVPSAALLWSASFRFLAVGDFLETGHPIAAFAVLVAVSLPFVIALFRIDQDFTNYTALFENSWGIVIRLLAAALFVGVFWALVFLSGQLLELVAIDWIAQALEVEPVPFALTGLAAGLSLGAAYELRDYVAPDFLLRLLRLFVPAVVVVTVVFLGGLGLRGLAGLADLFGGVSAGAVLMAMACDAMLLIAAAVDRGGLAAVQSRFMRASVILLALMLPALAGLAAFAVRERVGQYGWTPDRLAAATAAVILCGYGATHAISVLFGGEWMQRIRRGNVLMAAVVLMAAAGWLAPVWSPQAISARSLEMRVEADPGAVADRDLGLLARKYGVAGAAALDRIEAALPEMAERVAQARADAAGLRPARTREVVLAELRAMLALRPDGTAFPEALFHATSDYELERFVDGCRRVTPGGAAGCLAVMADFLPLEPGTEGVLIYLSGANAAETRVLTGEETGYRAYRQTGAALVLDGALIDRLLQDPGKIVAVPAKALQLGDSLIFISP